jgi:DNA-binding beta-propeller fold protein YncE
VIGALALAAVLLGCVAPERGAGGAGSLLYVANGLDGTLTRLDAASGQVIGPPLPAGPAPGRVVAGPAGSALVLSLAARPVARLTYVAAAEHGWTTRAVTLDGLPARARDVLLAGDGQRYAVVAYPAQIAAPAAPPCRLALVDLATGAVVRSQIVCAARESLHSLALEATAAGPVAYLGLWQAPSAPGEAASRRLPARGEIVAIQADTGTVTGRMSLAGVPEHLVPAARPGRVGERLYCVEGSPGPEVRNPGSAVGDAGQWQLLGLNPATLELESALPLPGEPAAVAVAPDGNTAYVRPTHTAALRSTILHVDLTTGHVQPPIVLPGERVGGLVVTGERLYVPHSGGSAVWAVDRRRGRLAQTISVGRHPLGLTLARP